MNTCIKNTHLSVIICRTNNKHECFKPMVAHLHGVFFNVCSEIGTNRVVFSPALYTSVHTDSHFVKNSF